MPPYPEHIFFPKVNKATDIEIVTGKHFSSEQVLTKKARRGKKLTQQKFSTSRD